MDDKNYSDQKPTVDSTATLVELKQELVSVLEKLNAIRPVQFLDWESEYVYNFFGVSENPEDGRIYIHISGRYDNLPSHEENPLCDGRGKQMLPQKVDGIL